MVQINLPKDALQKEAFKSLPAKEKEEYLSNLLMNILELNPDGATNSQIKEATGFTYSTIWHHLEMLNSTAQCHKISKGNLDMYYSVGTISHLGDYDKDKAKYSIGVVENSQGKFVCIHEKRENRTGNQAVCRGVSIPIELIDNIIGTLNKAKVSHLNEKEE